VDIDLILKLHNDFRQSITDGKVKDTKGTIYLVPKAKNMAPMTWDNEMAKQLQDNAEKNAKANGHMLGRLKRVSHRQNPVNESRVLIMVPAMKPINWSDFMKTLIDEIEDFDMANIQAYEPGEVDIGFAALISGGTNRVGCGAAEWVADEDIVYSIMECGYAPFNLLPGQPMYT
jgi:hypothetical protein